MKELILLTSYNQGLALTLLQGELIQFFSLFVSNFGRSLESPGESLKKNTTQTKPPQISMCGPHPLEILK